jgi:hypothetical protein
MIASLAEAEGAKAAGVYWYVSRPCVLPQALPLVQYGSVQRMVVDCLWSMPPTIISRWCQIDAKLTMVLGWLGLASSMRDC